MKLNQSCSKIMARIIEYCWGFLKDNCEVCHGKRGVTRGNENIIDGKIVCDYCTSDLIKIDK
jgi:hypothetical protein